MDARRATEFAIRSISFSLGSTSASIRERSILERKDQWLENIVSLKIAKVDRSKDTPSIHAGA